MAHGARACGIDLRPVNVPPHVIGVNRTKVRKVSQDFSIICHINMLSAWEILGFVAFPSTFGGHFFFVTHCQTRHLKSCETLRTFVRFTPSVFLQELISKALQAD